MKTTSWILAAAMALSAQSAFAGLTKGYCPLEKGNINVSKQEKEKTVAALLQTASLDTRQKSYKSTGRK